MESACQIGNWQRGRQFVGHVTDKVSVWLWSASFCRWPESERQNVVLIGGGQNVRHQQGEVAAHFAVTSQENQDCKMRTWSQAQRGGHFFRDVAKNQKCILHFWFSKAHFSPLNRRMDMECIMHLALADLLPLARHHQLSGYIHLPQMTSHYVIFGQLF